jgi:putative peptidoglycan lipid II flippase
VGEEYLKDQTQAKSGENQQVNSSRVITRMQELLGSSQSARTNAAYMAVGTAVSKVTGLVRIIALAYALGLRVGDSYNLANNTPNTLYDLLLGGIIASTIVPVFSSRLATSLQDRAWRSISAVVTISIAVLGLLTIVFEFASPFIIEAYSFERSATSSQQTVILATQLLRLFAPQLFFYGVIAMLNSTLYSRGHFSTPAFAPIFNNVFSIAVLVIYSVLYPHPTTGSVLHDPTQMLILGVGTTFGVFLQTVALLPAIRRYAPDLRVSFDYRDPVVLEITRLSGWTFGYVLANQIALFVVLAIAFAHQGYVTAYNYAYLFFQLPYSIVSLSIMSAVQPQLAALWAKAERQEFQRKLASSLRAAVTVTIPVSAIYLSASQLIIYVTLAHGAMNRAGAQLTARALIGFAVGLPGFAAFLSINQALQSMKRNQTVFFLYFIENLLNIVLAFILTKPFGILGLSLSFSLAYDAAAVVGVLLTSAMGLRLGYKSLLRSWLNSLTASVVCAAATFPMASYAAHQSGIMLYVSAVIVGALSASAFVAVTYIANRFRVTQGA